MNTKTINEFTELLSSSAPTPGGGGASALVGALAASLGSMVGSLTIGKKKYAQYTQELEQLMTEAEQLRVALLAGINKDAEAFAPLAKAYSIPKDTPGRDQTLEECLKVAAEAPFSILNQVCSCIDLLARFGEIGSKLAISDAATGAMFAYGALYGAAINVKVNTKLMKDREYADQLNQKVDALTQHYSAIATEIYQKIEGEMIYHG